MFQYHPEIQNSDLQKLKKSFGLKAINVQSNNIFPFQFPLLGRLHPFLKTQQLAF